MTDIEIINIFFKDGVVLNKRFTDRFLTKEVKEYLDSRFNDSLSYKESVLRIFYNIEKRPVCPICGGEVLFIGKQSKLYLTYCCRSCLSKDNVNKILKKYGTKCTLAINDIKEKTKETLINKYGVEHNWKIPEIRAKCTETCKERYGDNYIKEIVEPKRRETLFKKYGNAKYINIKKIENTRLLRTGYKYPMQDPDIRPIILKKREATLNKNHSWNSSKIERDLIDYFQTNNINFHYQYKSELYPFNCDFYLDDYDLYIEIQGFYTHGFHIFNPDNENDIKKLNELKERNRINAINVWTISDPLKRQTAKQNNLRYLEIFSIKLDECIKEINEYIEEIRKKDEA